MTAAFVEIPVKGTSKKNNSTNRVQFVCAHHKATVCGTCCMDFMLANRIRYDFEYLHCEQDEERVHRVFELIQEYYASPKKEMHQKKKRGAGPNVSPKLAGLFDAFEEQEEQCNFVELVGYLCYFGRSTPPALERMNYVLDKAMQSLPDVSNKSYVESTTANQSKRRMTNKAKRTVAKKKEKQQQQQQHKMADFVSSSKQEQSSGDDFECIVQEMISTLAQAGVRTCGPFFDEFDRISTALDHHGGKEALALAFDGLNITQPPSTNVGTTLKASFSAYEAWMRFLLEHVKDGVPGSDPGEWPPVQILVYLENHGISPTPVPTNRVLVQVAQLLIQFCACCMVTIKTRPKPQQTEPQVAEPSSKDDIKQEVTVQRTPFVVEPQIPPNLNILELPELNISFCEPVFALTHKMHRVAFGSNSGFHDMLYILEDVAMIYDKKSQPIVLRLTTSEQGTKDQQQHYLLEARPLLARQCAVEGNTEIPLLGLEYRHAPKYNNNNHGPFQQDKNKKKIVYHDSECTGQEMQMLLSLLEQNASHVIYKDYKQREGGGWNFSVIRPIDPTKRGGVMTCPACGEPATKLCSRCGLVAYCSRECQKSDWKNHKKQCVMKQI